MRNNLQEKGIGNAFQKGIPIIQEVMPTVKNGFYAKKAFAEQIKKLTEWRGILKNETKIFATSTSDTVLISKNILVSKTVKSY